MDGCVFCKIVAGDAPATITHEGRTTLTFVPLEPHAPGHLLVVPKVHVADATVDPEVTEAVFRAAVLVLGKRQGNLLTSVGTMATQTVHHLHVHVIPRHDYDGLHEDRVRPVRP